MKAPTQFSFTPATIPVLRQHFLDHHEHVLGSSLATVSRYRAATAHLERYSDLQRGELPMRCFVRHLRRLKVAPNGPAVVAKVVGSSPPMASCSPIAWHPNPFLLCCSTPAQRNFEKARKFRHVDRSPTSQFLGRTTYAMLASTRPQKSEGAAGCCHLCPVLDGRAKSSVDSRPGRLRQTISRRERSGDGI